MKQFVVFACLSMMISTTLIAEETPQTCANGAGTVITGAVTEHKYCRSNQQMNWWNAVAWCDALGRQLFSMDDCGCSELRDCSKSYPELISNLHRAQWTSTSSTPDTAYYILGTNADYHQAQRSSLVNALCK